MTPPLSAPLWPGVLRAGGRGDALDGRPGVPLLCRAQPGVHGAVRQVVERAGGAIPGRAGPHLRGACLWLQLWRPVALRDRCARLCACPDASAPIALLDLPRRGVGRGGRL